MADQLTDLLRSRFAGHEVDVPPSAWESINGQLDAAPGDNALRETLQKKFQGHEVNVPSSAWTHISGQLAPAGTVAGTSAALWIAAGVAAVLVGAGALLWNGPSTDQPAPLPPTASVEKPAASTMPNEAEAAGIPVAPSPAPAAVEAVSPLPAVANTESMASKEEADVTSTGQEEMDRPEVLEPPVEHPATTESPETSTTAPSVGGEEQAAKPSPEQQAVAQVPAPGDQPPAGQPTPLATREKDVVETPVEQPNNPDASTGVDPFPREKAQTNIFIPNVFSPQGDGINDRLKVVVDTYERVDVKVFSTKSGALMFHSNDLGNMWDGRLPSGNNAEEGYYRCVVRVTDAEGGMQTKSEVVRLYR